MRYLSSIFVSFGVLGALSVVSSMQAPPAARVVLYEGARLITGTDRAPIENSAFLVDGGRFRRVATRGAIPLPAGAVRVDLTGRTVVPAFVDSHAHLGYMDDLTIGPQNYTRETLLDHLQRYAFYGVAAGATWGSDYGDMPFQMRDSIIPGAARFVTMGRGITTPGEGEPDNMRQNAHVVASAADVRTALDELAGRRVKLVKTWVQDRGGRAPKLSPELYRVLMDEAHKRGLKVVVHATAVPDVKDLLRAGIDGFAHLPADVDDELLQLLKERPHVFFTTTLGGGRRNTYAPWLEGSGDPLVRATVTPAQIQRLQQRLAALTPDARERAREGWVRTSRVVARLVDAGVPLALGSDGGGMTGDQFIGWTVHTELENMVSAGMTPLAAIIAGTRTAAQVLGLDDLGSVEEGKSADFVVLEGNPLDDITNTRRISEVFLRGSEVDRAALAAKWRARASN